MCIYVYHCICISLYMTYNTIHIDSHWKELASGSGTRPDSKWRRHPGPQSLSGEGQRLWSWSYKKASSCLSIIYIHVYYIVYYICILCVYILCVYIYIWSPLNLQKTRSGCGKLSIHHPQGVTRKFPCRVCGQKKPMAVGAKSVVKLPNVAKCHVFVAYTVQ